MTKNTNAPPVHIQETDLEKANGGLFTLDIGTTENVLEDGSGALTLKNVRPKGVLIGQQGND